MEKKKTKAEVIGRKKQAVTADDGSTYEVDMEEIKLTDTEGNEKVVSKPVGERVSEEPVRQSELIYVKDPNKEYIEITGVPVEVDEDAPLETAVMEAIDYYMAAAAQHQRLEVLDPGNPEACPFAVEVEFEDFVTLYCSYIKDQLSNDLADIRERPELQYYITVGDMTGYDEQISLMKMAMENLLIAYEKFLHLPSPARKGVISDAADMLGVRTNEEHEVKSLTDRLKRGEGVEELLANIGGSNG